MVGGNDQNSHLGPVVLIFRSGERIYKNMISLCKFQLKWCWAIVHFKVKNQSFWLWLGSDNKTIWRWLWESGLLNCWCWFCPCRYTVYCSYFCFCFRASLSFFISVVSLSLCGNHCCFGCYCYKLIIWSYWIPKK